MTQSREVLAMMDAHTTTFGRQRGCTISRCGAFLLGSFFLICLVATGLLVYHFAPCPENKQVKQCDDILDNPLLITARKFSETPAKKKVDVRLPRAVVPDSYEIWLIPFIWEGNFTFHGEVNAAPQLGDAIARCFARQKRNRSALFANVLIDMS